MSYILEALKKAQAERQIGATPTIHAPTLASVPAGQGRSVRRAPVIVAMVLMGAAIAGLVVMLVRQQGVVSQPSAGAALPAPALAANATATPATVPPVSAPGAVVAPADVALTAGAPVAAATAQQAFTATPLAIAAAPQAAATAPQLSVAAPQAAVAAPTQQATASSAAGSGTTPAAAPTPQLAAQKPTQSSQLEADAAPARASVATAAPPEEHIQSLQDLPEPIQRAIPPIALGGYMYSKNPADRLLLIDKVLRKEGEEVGPGLLLEKLQPKQAVFRFRGYRYKIPL